MGRMLTSQADRDVLLKPGQKVRVVRTVAIAIDIDIADFLREYGETGIYGNALEADIENNWDVPTMLDQWDDAEITDIKVELTEIL